MLKLVGGLCKSGARNGWIAGEGSKGGRGREGKGSVPTLADLRNDHYVLRTDSLQTLQRTRSLSSEHVYSSGTVHTGVRFS